MPTKTSAGPVDQWISDQSVDQWWKALPRRSRGAEARRKQREESTTDHKGNWRVPCSCLCVETPVVAHRCFTLPRSSILCGCINVTGRQVNAVWGRYPTACTMYVKKSLEFVGGSSTKSLPGVSAVAPGILWLQLCLASTPQGGHSRDRQASLCRGTADPLPRLDLAHTRRIYLPKTALAILASLCPFPVPVSPSSSAYTYLKQPWQPLQIFNQKF
jgi:hypothetical protein